MIDVAELRRVFGELYGSTPRTFAAPGRVNLIGEHTDYNDGYVLPVAIDRQTFVAAAARDDRRIRVHSLNVDGSFEIDLDAPAVRRRGTWQDYVEGVARVLESRGARLRGADIALSSDVPEGAGLSSSAALELSVGYALAKLSNEKIDKVALALAGQEAEHTFVGTMSGIMDQYVAALGREGIALLIDCRTLRFTPIPVDTSNHLIVVCDSGVKHSLASSEYNTRREECMRGVELLQETLPHIRALRDVTIREFEQYQDRLPEPIRRRCRHVVTENARTLAAADALRAGDFAELGTLMGASHRSLRDDYEVSCAELDILVELANGLGIRNARMTGGGFGGSTVNLVRRDLADRFGEEVARDYRERTGIDANIYVTGIGDGVREIV